MSNLSAAFGTCWILSLREKEGTKSGARQQVADRKVVAAKETKKLLEPINLRLQLVMKIGKYVLGFKQTLKMSRQDKAKLVILANRCLAWRQSEIEDYARLAKTGVHHSSGHMELGTACGKSYRVCTLAIIDPGDSDIIRSRPEQTGEK
ncbi:60S ribosomal protein L30-like [Echinops telfairi]|uniref:Large ribosomal subunit protein eL30 n=1 Tax=Echinops telfairi TaxID=9371 RepID=A0ABM1VNI1_ECHTE|nr:60S ribosomal protein L30-like [Echinops telfairi]